VTDQEQQDVEHLRLDRDDGPLPPQLEAAVVELAVAEGVDHRTPTLAPN
jgi:hypothetical protein